MRDEAEAPPPAPVQELYCFLESSRPCAAECVAYEPHKPEDKEYAAKPWAHCMVLVNMHRTGKHLVVLASSCSKVVTYVADRVRTSQQPPPSPKG